MTPETPPTGHYKTSVLQAFAREALDNGRPVLIVPSSEADTDHGSPHLTHDEEGRQFAYLPAGIAVVFVGSEGFACASSQLNVADSIPRHLISGSPARVMGGAISEEDRIRAQQSLHASAPESGAPTQNPDAPETERD